MLSVGAWAVDMYGARIPTLPLHVERRVLFWFEAAAAEPPDSLSDGDGGKCESSHNSIDSASQISEAFEVLIKKIFNKIYMLC